MVFHPHVCRELIFEDHDLRVVMLTSYQEDREQDLGRIVVSEDQGQCVTVRNTGYAHCECWLR